jgi:hypothetical protein
LLLKAKASLLKKARTVAPFLTVLNFFESLVFFRVLPLGDEWVLGTSGGGVCSFASGAVKAGAERLEEMALPLTTLSVHEGKTSLEAGVFDFLGIVGNLETPYDGETSKSFLFLCTLESAEPSS